MSEAEVDQILALLSVTIDIIMEDEASQAVRVLPDRHLTRMDRFATLGQAGQDIGGLARAAQIMLRRHR